ncbi:MAG: lamin tail domain-containing protein, partial [Acidimicrobiia bacterium]|nr:lamin tail domain-containing protein [Acidimicrobiia bacterium]
PDACGPAATAGAAAVEVADLRLDAAGPDAENLNDEWVELRNTGAVAVDLTGWRVRDESSSHRFAFPAGFTLEAGAAVRVRSGCGPDTASDLFWCVSGSAVWNNDGDTAFLLDPSGNVVATRSSAG